MFWQFFNEWRHFVYTHDGVAMYGYKDGKMLDTDYGTSDLTNALGMLHIGSDDCDNSTYVNWCNAPFTERVDGGAYYVTLIEISSPLELKLSKSAGFIWKIERPNPVESL